MSLHHGLRSAAGASVADPDFKNVSLLLLGNGTNGGQNNTFTDGSSNAFSVTRYGNTTQGTFSPFGYNWSNYFDGTGDYLTLGGQSDFAFGTGDFTVECWVFPQNNAAVIYDSRPASTNGNYLMFAINSSNQLEIVVNNSVILAAGSIAANSWSHIAVTRSGTSLRGFVNGSQVGSTVTNSTDFLNGTSRPIIGTNGYTTTANLLTGNISNLRVLKGTAQYTGSYTVPTAPLTAITNTSLLTCQSNRFIDNSSNAFTITPYGNAAVTNFAPFPTNSEYSTGVNGGSGYFDGSGDYLSIPYNSAFDFGTGDFTIEAWIYLTASPAAGSCILGSLTTDGTDFQWRSSTTIALGSNANAWRFTSNTTTFPLNTWFHIAVTRASGTAYIWLNGASIGSGAETTSFNAQSGAVLVGRSSDGYFAGGYISSLRVTKTAQYTSAFTPSTTPLTAITNTSLLLNFTNASILDSTGKNDLETVGDAQISTATKKYGTGSLKFDGTGDYLTAGSSTVFDLGSSDFTIECWLYSSSFSSAFGIVSRYDAPGGSARGWALRVVNSTTIRFIRGADIVWDVTVSTMSTSTWYHIAVTRSGSSLRMFVDGTQVGTTQTISTFTDAQSSLQIGRTNTITDDLNGYIDDLRITKGVARYTAAFTPPSRQLPAR